MPVGVNLDQIKTELGSYYRSNTQEIRGMFYQKTGTAQYLRTVSSVKGQFPAAHSITDRVIQGFTTVWNELGVTYLKANILKNYHMKINFPIVPADVLGSWAGFLYNEKLKKEAMPISRYIFEQELPKAIARDQEYLYGKGVYDADNLGTFGKSMDGLDRILSLAVNDTDKPVFQIPIAKLTRANAVDVVETFEQGLPQVIFDMPDETPIFMSSVNAYNYKYDAREQFGLMGGFDLKNQAFLTQSNLTGRKIIGLPCLNGTDWIFCTPMDNFLRLIDAFDAPALTDIQVADYKVKLFFEWWDGIAFWINQLVCVGVVSGSKSGLSTDNDLYYAL